MGINLKESEEKQQRPPQRMAVSYNLLLTVMEPVCAYRYIQLLTNGHGSAHGVAHVALLR